MNAIMGMIQIIKMQGMPADIKEYFDEINDASHTLLKLIDDVLDVTDMEHGTFQLIDATFDMNELLRDVIRTAKHNTSQKQQTFDYSVDSAIPAQLIGDDKRLKQVFTYLLANAVKFTPENGEIRFEAHLHEKRDGIVTLQVEVADNGIGIPEDRQGMLFDIFEQVDSSNTSQYDGIGIGLALSKRIIEMMDGDIWVESESGKGARFILTCSLKAV
jgi:signal transduction histidine kinase